MSSIGERGALDSIDKDQLKQLLLRCWMTHDAMWFLQSVNEVGIETANRLNRAAVRQMAAVEAKRIMRLLGMDGAATFKDVQRFVESAGELVIGDFMDFTWDWSADEGRVRFEFQRCFAHEGVSALGVADEYECGIFERVYGWLDALGVTYEVNPDVTYCTMHHDGTCVRDVRITPAT